MSGNYPSVTETSLPRIVQSIRDLFQGRSNAVGTFTLATDPATSTVVTAVNCGEGSKISITPQTANAAAILTTTYIQAADVIRGQFTVTHDANTDEDLTFSYSIQG
jgi:hypothetical protein